MNAPDPDMSSQSQSVEPGHLAVNERDVSISRCPLTNITKKYIMEAISNMYVRMYDPSRHHIKLH